MLCSCLSSYGRAWECDWGLTYTLVSSQVDADSNTRSRAHNRTTATAKMTAQTIYGFVWVVIVSGATPKGDHSSRDISCIPLREKKPFRSTTIRTGNPFAYCPTQSIVHELV